jgi:hypothetical protein
MVALLLCGIAFVAAFVAGRRSLVAGIGAVLAVGYFYGITRANVTSTLSHFIFDSAVLGLYVTQLPRPFAPEDLVRTRQLRHWAVLLIGWPLLMLLLPLQDPMVQLVGLRANVFFVPFLLLGARLQREDFYGIARVLAVLNLVAFGFALAEFFFGLPYFYPRNDVTDIIYRSNDIRASGSLFGAFRIPATFPNSSVYASTMVISVPVLLGAWLQKRTYRDRLLFTFALFGTVLGVFLSASRTSLMLLFVLLMMTMISGRMGAFGRVAWIFMLAGIGWVVSIDERLFLRIMSLSPDAVIERLSWSMNRGVLDHVAQYPMGNGLGGGGSSIPHFLLHLVRNPMPVENQYATIMLEQGLPGLLVWMAFIVWVLTRPLGPRSDPWQFPRLLARIACALYLATGFIGVGLFTAIPFTVMLFLWMAWLGVPQRREAEAPLPLRAPAYAEPRLAGRHA